MTAQAEEEPVGLAAGPRPQRPASLRQMGGGNAQCTCRTPSTVERQVHDPANSLYRPNAAPCTSRPDGNAAVAVVEGQILKACLRRDSVLRPACALRGRPAELAQGL